MPKGYFSFNGQLLYWSTLHCCFFWVSFPSWLMLFHYTSLFIFLKYFFFINSSSYLLFNFFAFLLWGCLLFMFWLFFASVCLFSLKLLFSISSFFWVVLGFLLSHPLFPLFPDTSCKAGREWIFSFCRFSSRDRQGE